MTPISFTKDLPFSICMSIYCVLPAFSLHKKGKTIELIVPSMQKVVEQTTSLIFSKTLIAIF